jgi:hypothetical protein
MYEPRFRSTVFLTEGEALFFTSLNGDVFVTDGMTLGGAAIKDDGTWD